MATNTGVKDIDREFFARELDSRALRRETAESGDLVSMIAAHGRTEPNLLVWQSD